MSKVIDHSKPLSDDDRQYLRDRSEGFAIDENDRIHKVGKYADDYVEPFHNGTTVGSAPVEPGSEADQYPQFVGERPYGVDRARWGGVTGKTEDEALTGNANEPHHTDSATSEEGDDEAEGVAIEDITDEQIKTELENRKLDTDGDRKEQNERLLKALAEEE